MIYVGLDVAKSKHDFYIAGETGEKLAGHITIQNHLHGYSLLLEAINQFVSSSSDVYIGLEATGHYSNNILHFLYKRGFTIFLLNPKQTSDIRKASTLRKTKTDKIDAKTLSAIIRAGHNTIKPYTAQSYHNEELKSLTRYRTRLVHDRAHLRVSIRRLITILFPEYEQVFSTIHSATSYTILLEYKDREHIAGADLSQLARLLQQSSGGRHGIMLAHKLQDLARHSIGTNSAIKYQELEDTIRRVEELDRIILRLDQDIKGYLKESRSTITTVPGIGNTLAASIIAEIGDISQFSHADKLVAFAGLSPATYQSGQFLSSQSKMEKRGSKWLRYAIMLAAERTAQHNAYFARQLAKKQAEGKAYRVAISHVARNLIRLIYRMEITGEVYRTKS